MSGGQHVLLISCITGLHSCMRLTESRQRGCEVQCMSAARLCKAACRSSVQQQSNVCSISAVAACLPMLHSTATWVTLSHRQMTPMLFMPTSCGHPVTHGALINHSKLPHPCVAPGPCLCCRSTFRCCKHQDRPDSCLANISWAPPALHHVTAALSPLKQHCCSCMVSRRQDDIAQMTYFLQAIPSRTPPRFPLLPAPPAADPPSGAASMARA
jgi:hypothetical protein